MAADYFEIEPVFRPNGDLLFGELLTRFPGYDTQKRINQAERDGSIVDIDLRALDFARRHRGPLSVNVSPITLSLALNEIVARTTPNVVLEITETQKPDRRRLRELARIVRQKGGAIALDDVGDGVLADFNLVAELIADIRPAFLKAGLHLSPERLRRVEAFRLPLVVERIETMRDLTRALGHQPVGLQGWLWKKTDGKAWRANAQRSQQQQRKAA